MGFYWKDGKDQLVARSGDLPTPTVAPEASLSGNSWTTFTMALRDPTPFEGPLEFARFLVTSLTFMRTIKRINLVVDGTSVLEVRKDITGKHSVSRPGLNSTSAQGMMRIQSVDSTSMVITARVMKWLSGEWSIGHADESYWSCSAATVTRYHQQANEGCRRVTLVILWSTYCYSVS